MSEFIYQCKGTDSDSIENLQNHWNLHGPWYYSIKYDGQYVQIHVSKDDVLMYTSSGKPYKNEAITKELLKSIPENLRPCILEGEYLGEGLGLHGGRKEAAVVTTLRTMYSKGQTADFQHTVRVFDVINEKTFEERLEFLSLLKNNKLVKPVKYYECDSLNELLGKKDKALNEKFEGLFAKSAKHVQIAGKRVKTALKFKGKHIVVAEVIGFNEGYGKYSGLVGALVCRDVDGLEFSVGSGLTDEIRKFDRKSMVGKQVKVKYESKGTTYVMPTFVKFI